MRTALLAGAFLVATAAPASAADTDYLIWDSDPNANPTQGRSGNWYAPDPFSVWEHPDLELRVKATGPHNEYMQIDLARHDGQRITEGSYVDQRVTIVSGGFMHADDGAEFTVEHLVRGPDGNISEFEGAVEHHGSDEPDSTFRAKISYRR
ncbi:hypothetical protein PV646_01735 [Streptomyces sp. ID05-26A]|nr:hypothetical protein [Streptomyces sp. ID05-26A]